MSYRSCCAHNSLLPGPPEAGQPRLARLTTILPEMSLAEALDTTRMHRVAGRTGDRTTLVTTRPFRAPHHPIADVGLIGGGRVPLPGYVSLAYNGVRCLDELPECRRHALEGLRQPLEESVLCTRARGPTRPGLTGGARGSDHGGDSRHGRVRVGPCRMRSAYGTAASGLSAVRGRIPA